MSLLLAEKAMIVRLSISQWTARKYDKDISKKIAIEHNTTVDAGKYNKTLIAKENLSTIQNIVNNARNFHYQNTLPWMDDGARLLPSKNYLNYTKEMRRFKADFENAVREFLLHYDDYINDACVRLNGLFKRTDYPPKSVLEKKYSFNIHIDPIPQSDDFRVSIQADEIDIIRKDIERRVAEAQAIAIRELWGRLYNIIKKVREKLSNSDKILRDSLINNVRETISILPRLNIFEDKNFDKIITDINEKICSHTPENLRNNNLTRQQVASEAEAILNAMSGYMST